LTIVCRGLHKRLASSDVAQRAIFVTTRLRLFLTTILIGLVTVSAHAQQAGASSPAVASPHTQQRSKAYTSFDNPYAPGGIYDPYRGSHTQSGGHGMALQSKPSGAGHGRSSEEVGGDSLNSASDDLGGGKIHSGTSGQCSKKKPGSSSIASGPGMNRLGTTKSSYSSLGRCGGLAGSGSSRTGSTSGMSSPHGSSRMGAGGLSGRQGMSSQGQTSSVGH